MTVLFNVVRWLTHHVMEVTVESRLPPGGRHAAVDYREASDSMPMRRRSLNEAAHKLPVQVGAHGRSR